ncbi:TPA: leucine--tRNA ligase [Candidatus Saccharibacteria bacterium]|nr:leucine--tRNA ligase [Candidatus Saccharibacteria bacterium]HRJ91012.1 leucine--tRNA ligase [Candidatus Saccharibacteria bacterium]
MQRYNPSAIEPTWQERWAKERRYEVSEDSDAQKFYISCMFPYPSGAGMHTGHAFEHAIVDSMARFHRQHGHNVLNPMGWDAFGLPAENYAIKTGTAPAEVTKVNIANFKNQLNRMGASLDWSRELNTSDPEYYRWTQWIFAEFFKRGLAYQKESMQWWCPVDKTVLANEQVINGRCWRCENEVEKKSMKQWFLKITDYADALLEELPALDWPSKIKTAQENWIGKSEGAEIDFTIAGHDDLLKVFTTRPDTIFGATFMVVAPEHPIVKQITTDDAKAAVESYVSEAVKRSEIERMSEGKEKTGVFTGAHAINPASGKQVPIWVADYVLYGYGTGAIMAVPAHDERDFAFADKYKLPVTQVVAQHEDITDGYRAIRKDADNLKREVVDVIVRNQDDKYLLLTSHDETYFVGGGVEGSDSTLEEAIRRELLEETGYSLVKSIKQVTPYISAKAYIEKKGKNQHTWGAFYEVEVDESQNEHSEADEGKHEIIWVDKSDVGKTVTLSHHKDAWNIYLSKSGDELYHGEGCIVNSGQFDGMSSSDAREEIVAWLESQGVGKAKTTYKMRDWLLSRQRYWGAPIPIVHCEKDGAVAVPEDQLPVLLPEVKDYAPKGDGKSVLAREPDWVNTTCPQCGGPAQRETDTMDGYACSSWYLMRYTDARNDQAPWAAEKANYWAPLDMYVGGDHAVAHLLYVRFWTHVFKEMGLTGFNEPVKKLVYHGYINAEDGSKMSKSKGNVVDPLEVIDQGYGADALRVFLLFLGPIELNANWSSKGIAGVYRFLNRVWTISQEYMETEKSDAVPRAADIRAATHRTIKKVTDDYHRLSFNTAIAALMEFTNDLYKWKLEGFGGNEWDEAIDALVRLLAPMAPHMGAELWQQLGNESWLEKAGWPTWDDSLLVADTMTIIVQVNGKLRAKLEVDKSTSEDEIKNAALADEHVQKFVGETPPKKVIYVPGKLVSIVC